MPLLSSSYQASLFLKNGHLNTIYPNFFRKGEVSYVRERITTPDEDFLDVDWLKVGSKSIVILAHGLEGDSDSKYIKGMGLAFNRKKWDALAMNYRGCSGEPNLKLRAYHSGATGDLHTVVEHVIKQNYYDEIVLVGFSLGGNLVLKYTGERGKDIHPLIKKTVAFSTPCDLASGAEILAKPTNYPYMYRFLKGLTGKMAVKAKQFPMLNVEGLSKIRNFKEFDDRYTAPLHGFKDAQDYWNKCSSLQFLPNITIPTLLVNAKDDPFLSEECYPYEEAKNNPNFYFEAPKTGGHVGFVQWNEDGEYWSEKRAVKFVIEGK